MKNTALIALGFSVIACAGTAAQPAKLDIRVDGIRQGDRIPEKYAFCQPDKEKHTKDGGNISPTVTWSQGPEGTQSYTLIMHDTDVPTTFDNANKEGKTIPADMKRKDFYHWVLTDIPADTASIAEGEEANVVEKKGKPTGKQPYGVRGKNDVGQMHNATFGGYDGPCPPWNDAKLHHYHFTVYALDVPSLGLSGNFSGQDALNALKGHVLAQGSLTGTFTQNQKLLKP